MGEPSGSPFLLPYELIIPNSVGTMKFVFEYFSSFLHISQYVRSFPVLSLLSAAGMCPPMNNPLVLSLFFFYFFTKR